jgi:hypothetical protein
MAPVRFQARGVRAVLSQRSTMPETTDLPPIPADADLRQIPEMPIDVASVIAFAKTEPRRRSARP